MPKSTARGPRLQATVLAEVVSSLIESAGRSRRARYHEGSRASWAVQFGYTVATLSLRALTHSRRLESDYARGHGESPCAGLAVSAGGLALNVGLFGYRPRLERTRASRMLLIMLREAPGS